MSAELGTVFKRVDYDLSGLLHYIDIGDIGLPDIQRPFVWSATKVRDLFDSMYRGFPVGYILFWSNNTANGTKAIGTDSKSHKVPSLLIVDGQQRLTSLYSVFRGKTVIDENYQEKRIEIAFCPTDGKFEVCDAAIRKDPEFIPDISEMWAKGYASYKLVKDFLKQLRQKRELTDEEEDVISHNLDRLFDLQKYPFTALEIAPTVDEEQVADIFVRINSEGVKLNQAEFILTLLSVFAEDLRVQFETFCRQSRVAPLPGAAASPFNHFIMPSPDQLLRVSIALGFYRGRLKSVYQILRGKDLTTGEYSPDLRDTQFEKLRCSQAEVLNLTHWHQYFNAIIGAGFRGSDLISSKNALLFAYVFYLIGKTVHNIPGHRLDKLIGQWFYASTLTGRYSSSPETAMDADLNLIKDADTPDRFIEALSRIIRDTLTQDFWNITLPNELNNSASRSPWMFAYYAAQNLLKAPVLFSKKTVSDLLDPALKTKKKALERHHLFPRAYLESLGIKDLKQINQIANYALLEWPDNIDISAKPPADYLPEMRKRFSDEEWTRMCSLHALPANWETLSYEEFLEQRRVLMADIIRKGYESLE